MKQIITLDEFNTYSGNMEDDENTLALKQQLLDSATEVVEEYLGYSLIPDSYTEQYIGTNSNKLYLNKRPIEQVNRLYIDNKEVSYNDYSFNPDCVYLTNGKKFPQNSVIDIEYSTCFIKIPSLIKTTILRIATLLLSELGENIAVTSKSFSDGSRQFVNYTNFDKFLKPLGKYKVFNL